MNNIYYKHKESGHIVSHELLFDTYYHCRKEELQIGVIKNGQGFKWRYKVLEIPFSIDFEVITTTGFNKDELINFIQLVHMNVGDLTTKMSMIRKLENELIFIDRELRK